MFVKMPTPTLGIPLTYAKITKFSSIIIKINFGHLWTTFKIYKKNVKIVLTNWWSSDILLLALKE